MKPIKWSIYQGSTYIDSGTIYAEDDKEALAQVMEEPRDLDDDKDYKIKAGDLTTSSYGDEFARTVSAVGMTGEEEPVGAGGYHYGGEVEYTWGITTDVAKDVRDMAEKIFNQSIYSTPVDTGRFKYAWIDPGIFSHCLEKALLQRDFAYIADVLCTLDSRLLPGDVKPYIEVHEERLLDLINQPRGFFDRMLGR